MKSPWARSGRTDAEQDPTSGTAERALLISIRPKYANAILDGTKSIELRRTLPTLGPDALALIYSSSPTKALVGWATIGQIFRATPTALWREHKRATGVTPAEFKDYFEGRTKAYGLHLSAVGRAERAVHLAELRTYGLEPPQSWRYVTADLAESLRRSMSQPATVRPVAFTCKRSLAVTQG